MKQSTKNKCNIMGKKFLDYLEDKTNNPTITAMCASVGVSKGWYFDYFLRSENDFIEKVVVLLESRKQELVSMAEKVFLQIAMKGINEGARIKAAENIIKIYGTVEQRKNLNGISVEIEKPKQEIDFSEFSKEDLKKFVHGK